MNGIGELQLPRPGSEFASTRTAELHRGQAVMLRKPWVHTFAVHIRYSIFPQKQTVRFRSNFRRAA